MKNVTAILKPHFFMYKDQWQVFLNALINFGFFFYLLREISSQSSFLIRWRGYIQNFIVGTFNAFVSKAGVSTLARRNNAFLVWVASTLLSNFINNKKAERVI
jgi:hypothetical protein